MFDAAINIIIIEYSILMIFSALYYVYKHITKFRITFMEDNNILKVYQGKILICKRRIKTQAGTYMPDVAGRTLKSIAQDMAKRHIDDSI